MLLELGDDAGEQVHRVRVLVLLGGLAAVTQAIEVRLDALGQEAEVLGNCFQAKKLMERVWEKRKEAGGVGEVRWRETMCEGPGILLLA